MRPLKDDPHDARREILAAAEKCFGSGGFAGTSIQHIIDETPFSKPVIYYHFGNKEGLYFAVLEEAYKECYAVMQRAANGTGSIRMRLLSLIMGLFEFLRDRQELTRLAFSTALSGDNELPENKELRALRLRNFELLHDLMKAGCESGELDDSFSTRDLANGIYGAISFCLMGNLTLPGIKLNRQAAETVVDLFLKGAGAKSGHRPKKESELK